jgi:heme A synthase
MRTVPTLAVPQPVRAASPRFARYAWAVLAYNLAVALWGAFVRASGSGAGCGNHWPLCGGQLSPAFATLATIIEFLHRATSGIDLVLVAALVFWAYREFPKGHPARLGATLSAVFLFTEALLGAALVLLEHVARNPSTSRGYSLSTHLVNTLTLIACLTLTAWWSAGRPAPHLQGKAAWAAGITLLSVMVLGVTGAIAALADTLFPAPSLASGFAQDFAPGASIFVHLRGIHPVLAVCVALWVVSYALNAANRKLGHTVVWLVLLQLGAGGLNMLLLTPIWLQMVHLLLAYVVWIGLVLLAASATTPS